MHDQPWDLNYCRPLIYSKWPRVAQIKTNSGQLQFILKRSLGEIQLTSDHTCLLVHGGRGDHFLISLCPWCTSWQSDINHRVIKQTPRSRAGSHGSVRISRLYYWPPLMLLFPFGSASHISAAVTQTDNIVFLYSLCNRIQNTACTCAVEATARVYHRGCRKINSNTARIVRRSRGMGEKKKILCI